MVKLKIILNVVIIWLANFASSDWSIPGPITYGTDTDGPITFAFFRFYFICTVFELVSFTNGLANHFGFDKGRLGLEISLFYDPKKKQKSRNNYLHSLETRKRWRNSSRRHSQKTSNIYIYVIARNASGD